MCRCQTCNTREPHAERAPGPRGFFTCFVIAMCVAANCSIHVTARVSINHAATFCPLQGFVAGTIIIGSLFLAKVFWDRGKSG